LISGAAGGVGVAAVQLACAGGAEVVASVRSLARHPEVAALGANQVIEPDQVGGHGPYNVSLELVGAPGVEAVLPLLAVGARVVVIGVGAGANVQINLLALMGSRSTIGGSTLRHRSTEEKASVVKAVEEQVVALLAQGKVVVPVAARFPMAEAEAAYERFAAGDKLGKIVLCNR
jgi:NADPH:quinone reductase-like Zn-dependent oxidoreductase